MWRTDIATGGFPQQRWRIAGLVEYVPAVNYTSLTSDMGTAAELQAMINACHAAGVRV